MLRILLILLLPLIPLQAEDPGLEGPGLTVNLISENQSVTAGKPFTVGLHIHHFPGFHTYWQNPGMVGMEPSIEWTLPEGFTASRIQWPYPQHTHMGEYPCYGYERDITLLVTITPPAKLETTSTTLIAKAMWMCCSKGCFPGYETFTLKLPVTGKAIPDPKAGKQIARARRELPATDHQATLTVLSKPTDAKIRVRLQHPKLAGAKEIHLFSTDRQISSDHTQKFKKNADGSMTLSIPRSEFGPENPANLPAVIQIDRQFLAVSGTYPK